MKNKPTYLKRLAFLFGLLLSLSADIFAQKEHTEEISVKPALLYFRFDKALVDSGYMDNGRTLRRLDELFSDLPNALKLYGTAASKHWQKKEPITEYAHWIMSPSQPSLLIKPDISTKKTN